MRLAHSDAVVAPRARTCRSSVHLYSPCCTTHLAEQPRNCGTQIDNITNKVTDERQLGRLPGPCPLRCSFHLPVWLPVCLFDKKFHHTQWPSGALPLRVRHAPCLKHVAVAVLSADVHGTSCVAAGAAVVRGATRTPCRRATFGAPGTHQPTTTQPSFASLVCALL